MDPVSHIGMEWAGLWTGTGNPESLSESHVRSILPTMAAARVLLRRPHPAINQTVRSRSSIAHRRYPPPPPHEFSKPCEFLGSWETPAHPWEAEARLDRLRKDYARQVKQIRREYAYEVEIRLLEEQRKADARREAVRIANEERKATKAAIAETRAAERKAFQEEFRQILMKERAKKLENWRVKEKRREQKNNEKKELLRKQSSLWITDDNLENRILEAVVGVTRL